MLDAEQAAAREFDRAADIALEQARSVHRLGAHLLLALAQRQGPYAAVPGGRTEVTRALRALRTAGLVTRHSRGDWRLTEPLLGAALVSPLYRELGNLTDGDELPGWDTDRAPEQSPSARPASADDDLRAAKRVGDHLRVEAGPT